MRARWLTWLLPVPCLALALQIPMSTSPHEASACSGAGTAYFADQYNARIDAPGSVATDTLIAITEDAAGSKPGPSPAPKVVAHVESVDGTVVSLSRNDFLLPLPPLPAYGSINPPSRYVLRPTVPFAPDADYFLVLGGLAPASFGGPTTHSIGFHTGPGPRPVPPTPSVVETKPLELRGDVASAETFCCSHPGAIYYSCTEFRCIPRHNLAREVHTVGWPYASGLRWLLQVESERAADEEGWKTVEGKRTLEVTAANATLFLSAGEHACLRITAIDVLTGDRSAASDEVCWDAATTLPPVIDPCPGITSFAAQGTLPQECKKRAAVSVKIVVRRTRDQISRVSACV